MRHRIGPVAAGHLADADWLRARRDDGLSQRAVADLLGASQATVWAAYRRADLTDGPPVAGRTADRPGPDAEPDARLDDPDWLRREYVERGRTLADIGAETGTSATLVMGRLRRHGIPRRGPGGRPVDVDAVAALRDPVALADAVAAHDNLRAVAAHLGVAKSTLQHWLDHHRIATPSSRDRFQARVPTRIDDPDWLRGQYVERGRTLDDIAAELGACAQTVRDRIARHGIKRPGPSRSALPAAALEVLTDPLRLYAQLVAHGWAGYHRHGNGAAMRRLADDLGCSPETVHRWRRRHVDAGTWPAGR